MGRGGQADISPPPDGAGVGDSELLGTGVDILIIMLKWVDIFAVLSTYQRAFLVLSNHHLISWN